MAGYEEIVFVICGLMLLIAFLYFVVILAFARRMRGLGMSMAKGQQTPTGNTTSETKQENKATAPTQTMKQCGQCGKIILDEFGFCPRCGYDLK